jgi:pentapeptide MXKDX repeat protein
MLGLIRLQITKSQEDTYMKKLSSLALLAAFYSATAVFAQDKMQDDKMSNDKMSDSKTKKKSKKSKKDKMSNDKMSDDKMSHDK